MFPSRRMARAPPDAPPGASAADVADAGARYRERRRGLPLGHIVDDDAFEEGRARVWT